MAFAVLHGDPQELVDQASILGAIAAALDNASGQSNALHDAAREAGDNALATGIANRVGHVEPVLRRASTDLRTAQALLLGLEHELMKLDAQAQIAQRRVEEARQNPHAFGLALLLQHGVDHCHEEAAATRGYVATQLEGLAKDAPGYSARHPSWLSRFGHDVKDIVWGTATGVVEVVGGATALTWELVRDQDVTGEHWRQLFATADAIKEHPREAAHGVYEAVVRPDLMKSDPAAWVVNIGLLFTPGVAVKGVGAAARGSAAVRSGIAAASDVMKGSLRLAGMGRTGASAKLLMKAGIPADRIRVLDEEARAQIGNLHVWDLEPKVRGRFIERGVAADIKANDAGAIWLEEVRPNHERLDLHSYGGWMHSIKSLDPASPSYANPSALRSKVNSYMQSVAQYNDFKTIGNIPVDPAEIQIREVTLAIPDSGVTEGQAAVLRELHDTWANPGPGKAAIDISFVEVPR
jgi:hypothetical protein